MKEPSLYIFATISPKEAFYEKVKSSILSVIGKTLQEEGCYEFKLLEAENKLYLYEQWGNEEALLLHYEKPYITEVFANYETWLQKPVEVIKMASS